MSSLGLRTEYPSGRSRYRLGPVRPDNRISSYADTCVPYNASSRVPGAIPSKQLAGSGAQGRTHQPVTGLVPRNRDGCEWLQGHYSGHYLRGAKKWHTGQSDEIRTLPEYLLGWPGYLRRTRCSGKTGSWRY